MIVAVEIVVGETPGPGVLQCADVLEAACTERGFTVLRVAAPQSADNRLCLYLAGEHLGYDVEQLLDKGVRRDAFARLGQGQYLVRSWRGDARLHLAMAARSEKALLAAAHLVADRIAGQADFSRLDELGPPPVETP